MEKKQRVYLILGIVFSLLAIAFALFYYFGAIKFLDNYLALTYVVYFVGLAVMFAGSYVQNNKVAKITLFCQISYFCRKFFDNRKHGELHNERHPFRVWRRADGSRAT